ncbi:SIR2 family protein [Plasticicumulans sp.]|uniref:SIR2 family protein n=1 Tax=Plasticicumulans sp. TaxID=2307179 RepID=UPI003927C0A3
MTAFNADLINDIARRRVVLFIGSGVSASATTRAGTSIKTWKDFLAHANTHVSDTSAQKTIEGLLNKDDFLLACELLKKSLQEQWDSIVKTEYQQSADASELHKAIIELDQRIIITTNFDKLLETCHSSISSATHYPTLITEIKDTVFKCLRTDTDYIIKLHGCVDDENSLIFEKSSYIKKAYGNWIYSELLNTLLLTHTFMFIGFSMNDPAVSYFIEMHAQKHSSTRPHYIFLSNHADTHLTDISRTLRKLIVLPYDPAHNHVDLVVKIKELSTQSRIRRKEILSEEMKKLAP